jgi:transposase
MNTVQKRNHSRRNHRVRKPKTKTTVHDLPVCKPDAAGIDISPLGGIFIAVPPDRDEQPVRSFKSFTDDLKMAVEWLKSCRIRTVAMESTGVYWIPLCQMLEDAGIEVCLVNARHVKNVPGRKSDVQDSQWLQFLHSVGLLRASFRPPQAICALRAIARHRDNLLKHGATHIQHMQKALDLMNLHLHHVMDDLTGKTGIAIVEAILAGQRDPLELAKLRDKRIKADEATIAAALRGDYRAEHIFVLRQALDSWRHVLGQIAECDAEMERQTATLEGKIDLNDLEKKLADAPPAKSTKSKNQPAGKNWHRELHRLFGVDLTRVPGISLTTALSLLSELGIDWSRFPSAGHFASWLALCPENEISGGKVLRRRTRRAQMRLRTVLRMAAQSLHKSQGALGQRYRRFRAKLGGVEAITVMAHVLARILWHMVVHRVEYDETVHAKAEEKHAGHRYRKLKAQARQLGYELVAVEKTISENSKKTPLVTV